MRRMEMKMAKMRKMKLAHLKDVKRRKVKHAQNRERRRGTRPLILNERRNSAGHQWLRPVILATEKAEIRKISVRSQPQQIIRDPISKKKKIIKSKSTGRGAQMVKCLPSKCEALGSNPNTAKKKKNSG
jgi:hypothetical protein